MVGYTTVTELPGQRASREQLERLYHRYKFASTFCDGKNVLEVALWGWAGIGRGQLRVLDDRVEAKRRIFSYYQEALGDIPGIDFKAEAPYGRSNRWLTVILITPDEFGTDRETIQQALEDENIEARPVWKPMHLQPVFQVEGRKALGARREAGKAKKRYSARVVGGEVAADLFERGLCLPSGTAMNEEDLDLVISVIKGCRR